MLKSRGARKLYLIPGTATVVVGLSVHYYGHAIPGAVRDVTGDALWAAMIACWVSVIAPKARSATRYAVALLVCFAVETSQLWHTPALDSVRSTRLGALVIGTGFDPRDFLAYTLGVSVFVALDQWILRRSTPSSGATGGESPNRSPNQRQ